MKMIVKRMVLSEPKPAKYFEGLSPSMKRVRQRELAERRRRGGTSLGASDRAFLAAGKARKSSWTTRFRQLYPDLPADIDVLACVFDVLPQNLKLVWDKGFRAWQTSGSRPGANPFQWAWARVFKFLLVHAGDAEADDRDPDAHLRPPPPPRGRRRTAPSDCAPVGTGRRV